MKKAQLPKVVTNICYPLAESGSSAKEILVDSAAWFAWLTAVSSFAFECEAGHFTARRELRGGIAYWYAWRKYGGKLYKVYLGKTDRLTLAKLTASCDKLYRKMNVATQAVDDDKRPFVIPTTVQPDKSDAPVLLTTKLRAPQLPDNIVSRPRLIERFNRPIIFITAPAGFGKTTLVLDWIRQTNWATAWVSLDEDDNDSFFFLRAVVGALQTVASDCCQQTASLLEANEPVEIKTAVQRLINDLAETANNQPLALVLDDYHLITNQSIHDALDYMLAHFSAQLKLILISRHTPTLQIGRLRAKRQISMLQAEQLRLNVNEGATFFKQEKGVNVNYEDVETLVKRTQGWVTGLTLAALALQEQEDVGSFLASFDGSHTYLTEYFIEDVVQRQHQALQTFLLYTSILRHLNGNLCTAVTGQDNASDLLQQIKNANLFLVALDEREDWYRYHHLFAHALQQQLRRLYPQQLSLLHRKAASWYLEYGSNTDAIRHLLNAEAWSEAADVIEAIITRLLKRGELSRCLAWLQKLPTKTILTRQNLAFTYTRTLLATAQFRQLAAWLIEVKEWVHQQQLADSKTILGMVHHLEKVLDTMLADNGQNIEVEDGRLVDGIWTGLDAYLLGTTRYVQTNFTSAIAYFNKAANISAAENNPFLEILSTTSLAFVHILSGSLNQGEEVARKALTLAKQATRSQPAIGSAYLALGNVAYERNQLALAYDYLQKGIALLEKIGNADYLSGGYFILASVYTGLGQLNKAEEAINRSVTISTNNQPIVMLPEDTLAYRAKIWRLCGDAERAQRWADERGLSIDGQLTEWNSLTYQVYAENLTVKGHSLAAVQLLNRLWVKFENGMKHEPVIKLLVARALAHYGLQQYQEALQDLRQVITLGRREGYIRPFLELGSEMNQLITLYSRSQTLSASTREYLNTVQQALQFQYGDMINDDVVFPPSLGFPALSKREQEVLQLVASGLTNQEIAIHLTISTNTVKTHLSNIYQKLEVSNRTELVMQAKEHRII